MTQAPQAGATAPNPAHRATTPAPGPATPATARAATRTTGPALTEDVPSLLNRWQVIAVTACVLFAALTAGLLVLSWHANRAAADNTEQLVRVQNIQSTLFRADALATTAFLTGGLEPADQRAAYESAIDEVTRQVADAAEAQPADREALAALNSTINDYTVGIAQARDNNRQGFPVGAEYLRATSQGLRDDSLPILAALVDANSARAQDELDSQHPWLTLLPGLAAFGVLFWVNRSMARRFRRRFNLGVAGAGVSVGLLTIAALIVVVGQSGDNGDLRDGSYERAVDEASARSAANDAKSNESRREISRGSGQVFEDAWAAAAKVVLANAGRDTLPLWQTYADRHVELVELDDAGQYDQAVALATSADSTGTTPALDAFDTASQSVVTGSAQATTTVLRSGNTAILVFGILTLLLGLASSGLVTWGISQRRKEYS